MIGMFPVAKHPAIALFDSGASHTFINHTFVMKHGIPIEETKEPYHIQSPGGQICTREVVQHVPIDLGGWVPYQYADIKGSRYRYDPWYELVNPTRGYHKCPA